VTTTLTDPYAARRCDWADCQAWYDALTGPREHGWIQTFGFWAGLRLCPAHAGPGTCEHKPSAEMNPKPTDGSPWTSTVSCACGASTTNNENGVTALAWWRNHLREEGLAA
jgi:hypothetical protein